MREKIDRFLQAVKLLPYKWCWLVVMICNVVLFSWWDEVAVWGLGVKWDWRLIPIYYIVEYGVMLPLILYLSKKSYEKLELDLALRPLLLHSLRSSFPAVLYRKLKAKLRRRKKGFGGT